MRPTWMLTHLGQQTRHHHASADGDRLAIMEKPTLERYRLFLAQIYRFEEPVERRLIATGGLDRELCRTHLKTPRLLADLEALGMGAHDLATAAVRRFEVIDALGWLYVLHRNTLLHGLLFRYLQTKLPATMQVAGAYLSSFEGRAGGMLRQVGDVLDATARANHAHVTRIVAAGNEAFRAQRQWYSCDLREPGRSPAERPTTPRRAA